MANIELNKNGLPETPAGAALIELQKLLSKQIDNFEKAKQEAAEDIARINIRCATNQSGASRAVNLDRITGISAKIEATAEAIDILEYYISAANK